MPKKESVRGTPFADVLVNQPRKKGEIFYLADTQEVWFPTGETKKLIDLTSEELLGCPLYINNLYQTVTSKS